MSSGRVVSYQLSEAQREAVREQVRKRREQAFKKRREALESSQRARRKAAGQAEFVPTELIEDARGREQQSTADQKAAKTGESEQARKRARDRAAERADKLLAKLAAADRADPEIRQLRDSIDTVAVEALDDLLDQIEADVERICERRSHETKLEELSATVQAIQDDARATGFHAEAKRLAQLLEAAAAGVDGDAPRSRTELGDLERQVLALEGDYESLLADARALDLISKVWVEQGYEVLQADDHRSFLAYRQTRGTAGFVVSSTRGVLRADLVETSATGAATVTERTRACGDAATVEQKVALQGIVPMDIRVEDPHHARQLRRVTMPTKRARTKRNSSTTQPLERTAGLGR